MPTWISYAAAARMLGVAPGTVGSLVRRGELGHRTANRALPSIDRASVVALVERRAAERRRAQETARLRASRTAPPDDGQVWLDVATTAELLGVSRARVTQMIRAEKMPATRRGHRWWVLRQHAENLAAARAYLRR